MLVLSSITIIRGGARIPCRRGRQPFGEGALTYDFAKISEKLHEIEKILGRRRGRAPETSPLDPPPIIKSFEKMNVHNILIDHTWRQTVHSDPYLRGIVPGWGVTGALSK